MPTYEYKCRACGHQFEQVQSMKDVPLRKCPKCAKAKLERLIGAGAAVIFKGSGFYQTDYRSESYKKSAKADSDAGKPAAATTESKTSGLSDTSKPTAPAAKPEPKPASSDSGAKSSKTSKKKD